MPNSFEAALDKAEVHLGKGEMEDAEKIFRSVLAGFPESGRATEGLQKIQQTVVATASPKLAPPKEKIQEVIGLYNQGRLWEVIQKAEGIALHSAPSIMLFNLIAAANAGLKNLDHAIENFKKVLEINPQDAVAYYNIGNIYKEKKEYDAEIESYKKALSIKPDHVQSYNNRGNALKAKGDLDAAIEQFKAAINIKPDFAEAHYNLGVVMQEKGDLNASLKSYKKAWEIKPDYIEAYFNMGNALKDNGDLIAAIDSYNKAIEIKHDYAGAYINMGKAYYAINLDLEHPSGAIYWFELLALDGLTFAVGVEGGHDAAGT